MTASVRGAQLRGDLATFRERSRRGTYPRELRERAVAYAAERVHGGAVTAEIAMELGVRGPLSDYGVVAYFAAS